ncbi:MAG TPA: undecaprenyldiphospho-muramoylpentapeptide beta-N-acetylglucosaminyltransferase, partial [Burkholderiaceae bacterium]|nr:undecaprenyldiphospho-muramoylpentapeptide beta-N-acetylglucosaminyltransferase [Burkholderiaceae bacterium]
GTQAGIERGLVERHGIAFDAIDFSGLRGKGLKTLLLGGFMLLRALWQSRARLRARAPKVVFSTGGYVAVPAGMAASSLGVPLVLMNADAETLLSTRLLTPLAAGVLCGFDGAAAVKAGDKGLVTGNPVRSEIAALPVPEQRYVGRTGPLNLLVIGGSLGAKVLNETVPAALARLPIERRARVVHQCGAGHLEAVQAAYRRAGVDADILPFIDDLAQRYALADVVLCRAGAITITELAVAGVPAILVPLVVSTTQHQRTNAEYMVGKGAALHLAQSEFTAERLADVLDGLSRERLLGMANAARAVGRPDATNTVARVIERMAA